MKRVDGRREKRETGDRRQEIGDRRQETGDRRRETGEVVRGNKGDPPTS